MWNGDDGFFVAFAVAVAVCFAALAEPFALVMVRKGAL
jgi:hypothetical protein